MRFRGPFGWKEFFADCPEILLDGHPMEHVCEADDEAGYVIVEVQDVDGLPKLDATGEAFETLKLMGAVTFLGDRSVA